MEPERKPIILCIDDEEDICFALKMLFSTQGWETVTAQNVGVGLRLFRRHKPDLVLIDYHMPDVNGIEGVRRLRGLSASVPIIVFTIDESQSVADEFLAAGASDFALKPIRSPDIISRVRLHLRLLEQRRLRQGSAAGKGITQGTADLILGYLRQCGRPVLAGDIASGTGLAYQTVQRYLQHLVQSGAVSMESVYGRIGRPKQAYRWNKG